MDDPYTVLGVARDATADQIKSAFRKLARGSHPDLHPGDKGAENRFKMLNAAYDILSDPTRKARYDAGEIDAAGTERGARGWGRRPGGGSKGRAEGGNGPNLDDIWADMMRRHARAGRRFPFEVEEDEPRRGTDQHYRLELTFPEAALGSTRRITLPGGKSLDVRVPPGSIDGTTLRLKGQGAAGVLGAEAGDALVEVKVQPHPYFTREGDDVLLTLPVTLPEAMLGAKVTVPTIDSRVTLTITPGSNSATTLRLKRKGVPRGATRGDQLVTLQVMLPPGGDGELTAFLNKWAAAHPYEVRDKLKA